MLEIDQLGKVCSVKEKQMPGRTRKRETYTSANSDVAYIWDGGKACKDSGVSLPVLQALHRLQMPTMKQPHVVPIDHVEMRLLVRYWRLTGPRYHA